MSRKEDYEKKAEEMILPIVNQNGCELVDVEYVKEAGTWYLRIYADKEGGITIDDCENISRAFSDKLDENDFIEEAYVMEVSSPGLDRPLKKDKDFDRNLGEWVEVRLFKAVNGVKEYKGVLATYSKETVTIDLAEDENAEPELLELERKNIALIRLYFEW